TMTTTRSRRNKQEKMKGILKQGCCYPSEDEPYDHATFRSSTTSIKNTIHRKESVHFRDELVRYTFDSLANELISVRLAPVAPLAS
ncbi:hypothetical protein FOZ62_015696, partial [Perkinsus olseni]